MRSAFSLSITLFISMVLLLGSIFYIKVNKEKVNMHSKLLEKLESDLKVDSSLNMIKFYIATAKRQNNKIINDKLHDLNMPPYIHADSQKLAFNDVYITVQDTAGLINLFYPNSNYLANLLTNKKIKSSAVLKNSLDDWLDTDIFSKINGAEYSYYKNNGFKYQPRNKRYIQYNDELLNIKGMESTSYELVKDYLVYDYSANYNFTTMDVNMLNSVYVIPLKKAELLLKLKKKDIDAFKKAFYATPKKGFDPFNGIHGSYMSNSFKITFEYKTENTRTKKSQIINFEDFKVLYQTF